MRRTLVPLLLLFVSLRADAAVVLALSLDELWGRSDVVCLARVTQTAARDDDGRIVTDVRGDCERSLKGATDGDEIRWIVEGGVLGDVGMRVPGEPSFCAGDRAIVFLTPARGALRVTGMAQGALFVTGPTGSEEVQPPRRGATIVRRAPSGALRAASPWLASPRLLSDVIAELELRASRAP